MNYISPVKKIYRKLKINSDELIEENLKECPKCKNNNLSSQLKNNGKICRACGYHYKMSALERIVYICDAESFNEFNGEYIAKDILEFEGYQDKIEQDKKRTGINEAVITGIGTIKGCKCVLVVMESDFRMGSMGIVVGQKILEAARKAIIENIPMVSYIASGGARMQEGMFSLMQMSKTVSAFDDLKKAGLMSINILTNPTTGGVSASFALLGDVLLAEPGAVIGFAGKKVISQTLRTELPENFQTAEFLEEHGHIDKIVGREEQKKYLAKILKNINSDDIPLKEIVIKLPKSKSNNLTPLEKLSLIRKNDRPTTKDYLDIIVDDFVEFHGDRLVEDDMAIITGIGFIDEIKVVLVGHQRGKNLEENVYRNFGMAKPSGYRKAERIIRMADYLNLPVVTFIDTKGADPTASSEMENQSSAIAKCILAMIELKVPNISIVIGEGGSGGALAISTSNKILMMENAMYSVISPEGAASILWKDRNKIEKAIKNLKITAQDLIKMKIIDDIIPEFELNSSEDVSYQANIIKSFLKKNLNILSAMDSDTLVKERKRKYEEIGNIIKEENNNGK